MFVEKFTQFIYSKYQNSAFLSSLSWKNPPNVSHVPFSLNAGFYPHYIIATPLTKVTNDI